MTMLSEFYKFFNTADATAVAADIKSGKTAFGPDGKIVGAPILWTPAAITTDLWLDASDSDTITESAGAVSQWNDKSGNARHATQATGSAQPILQLAAQNGLDVIRFDGVDDFMSLVEFAQVSGQSIFLAGNTTSMGTGDRQFLGRSAGSEQNMAIYFGQGTANYRPYVYWNTNIGGLWATAIQRAAIFMWGFSSTGTIKAFTRVDGAFPSTSNFTVGTLTNWNSITNGSIQQAAFDAFEIIIVPSGLSNQNRIRMEGYLAHKWGLAALLSDEHFFKTDAPIA